MENMAKRASEPAQSKTSLILIDKIEGALNALENSILPFVEANNRLGGMIDSKATSVKNETDPIYPGIEGESFLLTLAHRIEELHKITNLYEKEVSRLNELI